MRQKNTFLLIFGLCILMPLVAYCESLLKAQVFPKTFEDLSFASQMELKAEGYAPFADLSAYDILTILETDEGIAEEIAANETQESNTNTANTNQQTSTTAPITTPTTTTTVSATTAFSSSTTAVVPSNAQGGYCAIKNPEIPERQQLPIGKPVFEKDFKYCSKYGYRKLYGKNDFHYGFDIGCTEANFNNPVFAIADGVVEKVHYCSKGSSAGNYILVNHKNGFKTYYMHLEKILVNQGQAVSAGCQIATLGFTGGAKVNKQSFANEQCPKMRKKISHLHYEIHYTGNETSINANGRTIQIKHGKTGSKSIDPSYFLGVPQHM